ncbi:hypothetical protein ACU61A_01060 [Pseudonocardia sichuanensis]
MSEPSRWGPPGFDAASGPTVPLPTAPRPPAPRPPVPPRPTRQMAPDPTRQMAPQPTRQMAPAPPAVRDDAYAGHDDRYDDRASVDDRYDDRYDYDDEVRGPRRPGRSRSRGQLFAGVVLVLALIVSVLLGVLTYQALVSVDLISADPFASVAGWTSALGSVALGALGVFLLAVIALVVARPKALAGVGLFASVLLPVAAVVVGVWYGGDVLRQNVQNDIEAESAEAAQAFVEELERNVPDIGPLRDLVRGLAEQSG